MSPQSKARSRRHNVLKWLGIILGAMIIIGFIGNLVDPVEPDPIADPTPTSAPLESMTAPASEPTQAPAPEPSPDLVARINADLAEYVASDWHGIVTKVTSENQTIIVDTKLIDPRQESSAEGMVAATVCSSTERVVGASKTVRVQEEDGTTFATNQFGQCEEY